MPAKQPSALGPFLRALRSDLGLTLRHVEELSEGAISNVYLSQLETQRRFDPHPRILLALARVYGVSSEVLFEKAGYVERNRPSEVDAAFAQVLADPNYRFGTRFHGELDEESKRVIIELYEAATKKRVLVELGGEDS